MKVKMQLSPSPRASFRIKEKPGSSVSSPAARYLASDLRFSAASSATPPHSKDSKAITLQDIKRSVLESLMSSQKTSRNSSPRCSPHVSIVEATDRGKFGQSARGQLSRDVWASCRGFASRTPKAERSSAASLVIPVNERVRAIMHKISAPVSAKKGDQDPTEVGPAPSNFERKASTTRVENPDCSLIRRAESILKSLETRPSYMRRFQHDATANTRKRLHLPFQPGASYQELLETLKRLFDAGCDETVLFALLQSEFGAESILLRLVFDHKNRLRKANVNSFVQFYTLRNEELELDKLKTVPVQRLDQKQRRIVRGGDPNPFEDLGKLDADSQRELDRVPYMVAFLKTKLRHYEMNKVQAKVLQGLDLYSKVKNLKFEKRKKLLNFKTAFTSPFRPDIQILAQTRNKPSEAALAQSIKDHLVKVCQDSQNPQSPDLDLGIANETAQNEMWKSAKKIIYCVVEPMSMKINLNADKQIRQTLANHV